MFEPEWGEFTFSETLYKVIVTLLVLRSKVEIYIYMYMC